MSLPKGVRTIFSVDGSEKVKSLDKLKAGHSYVVSSTDHFIKLNYECISGVSKFETGIVPSASCISGPGGFAGAISLSSRPLSGALGNDDENIINSYGATATVTIRNTHCILDPLVPVTCKIVPCSIAPRSGSLPRTSKHCQSHCNNNNCKPPLRSNNIGNSTLSNGKCNNSNSNKCNNSAKNDAIVAISGKVKGNNMLNCNSGERGNCASSISSSSSASVNSKVMQNGEMKVPNHVTISSDNNNCKCNSNETTVMNVPNSTVPCNTSDGRSSSSSCASASSYSNYASNSTSSCTGKDTGNGSSSSGSSSIASNVKSKPLPKSHLTKCTTAPKNTNVNRDAHQSNRLTLSHIAKQNNTCNLSNSYSGPSVSSGNRKISLSTGNCKMSRPMTGNSLHNSTTHSGIRQSASSATVCDNNTATVRAQRVNRISANSDQYLLLPTAKRGIPGKAVTCRLKPTVDNKTSVTVKGTPATRTNRLVSPASSASTNCVPQKLISSSTRAQDKQCKVTTALNKCRIVPSASTGRMVNAQCAPAGNRRPSRGVVDDDKKGLNTATRTINNSRPTSTAKGAVTSTAATPSAKASLKNNASTSESKNALSIAPSSDKVPACASNNICQVKSTSSTSCSSTSGNSSDSDEDISSPIDSVTPPFETELIRRNNLPADSTLSALLPKEVILKYEIGMIIGDGNFAVVHECLNRQSKMPYALKIIDKSKCKGRESMIANEVAILARISHPNIIQFIDQFDYTNELYLFTELVKVCCSFCTIAALLQSPLLTPFSVSAR